MFKFENFKLNGFNYPDLPAQWAYTTNNPVIRVIEPDYFSDIRAEIKAGDMIFANCSDGPVILQATSESSANVYLGGGMTPDEIGGALQKASSLPSSSDITVTISQTASITNALSVAPTDDLKFTLGGCDSAQLGTLFGGVRTRNAVLGNEYLQTERLFDFTGRYLEIKAWGYSASKFEIFADDVSVAIIASIPNNNIANYILVDFGSYKSRNIRICAREELFLGFNIESFASMSAKTASNNRVIFAGDSFTKGVGSNNTLHGFVHHLRTITGNEQIWGSGAGGTGYIKRVSSNNLNDRVVSDITNWNPSVVITFAGYNDYPENEAAFQAAVDTYYATLTTNLPTATIVIAGPDDDSDSTGLFLTYKNVLQAKAVEIGAVFIDTVGEAWFNGVGNTASPTGTGNADQLVTGGHPNELGHEYLANRFYNALKASGVNIERS